MKILADKLFILLLCLLNPAGITRAPHAVAALLAALCFTSLCSYADLHKARFLLSRGYVVLCFFVPSLLFYLPLLVYDFYSQENSLLRAPKLYLFSLIIWPLPVLFHMTINNILPSLFLLAAASFSFYLSWQSSEYKKLMNHLHTVQDTTKEKSLHLEQKNKDLLEKQEYEVRLATLTERNRIAREIHDNVGHLLTRALFQVSAMQVVFQKEEELSGQLFALKKTLDSAMDNVRSSVHNLHEESVDLEMSLQNLTSQFQFCPVELFYNGEITSKEIKSCFIAIVREALSNIARHSNATKAMVSVLEHPGLYQLTIKDNGTNSKPVSQEGIGLINMQERVEAFHGIMRTEQKNGFRIFISIPKEMKSTQK